MTISDPFYSIYIHIPFCKRRCSYCDFNTFAKSEYLIPSYINALCNEIETVCKSSADPLRVHTIFFGGGTPSLIPIAGLEKILDTVYHFCQVVGMPEITLEANPGTIDQDYLTSLHCLGINRLSLGMQSAHPEDLHLLHRLHEYPEVIRAVKWARQASFTNISLDLMFGIPGQSVDRWRTSLQSVLLLKPEHLSLYALTLEEGTPLNTCVERGLVAPVDDDIAAEMYELAMETLEKAGYNQYEISNWAKQSMDGHIYSCKHNLQYWHNLPYLGFGAGAHGYAKGVRCENVPQLSHYINTCHRVGSYPFPSSPANLQATIIDRDAEIDETMMVGLRLTQEGISRSAFFTRFGQFPEDIYGTEIAELIQSNLLEYARISKDILRLTQKGRLLGNQVFMRFIRLQ
jgi:oxygen-independent coproporphyrinogen III oxidase